MILPGTHTLRQTIQTHVRPLSPFGFALSRIDEEEAQQTLALLSQMGEVAELEESG